RAPRAVAEPPPDVIASSIAFCSSVNAALDLIVSSDSSVQCLSRAVSSQIMSLDRLVLFFSVLALSQPRACCLAGLSQSRIAARIFFHHERSLLNRASAQSSMIL